MKFRETMSILSLFWYHTHMRFSLGKVLLGIATIALLLNPTKILAFSAGVAMNWSITNAIPSAEELKKAGITVVRVVYKKGQEDSFKKQLATYYSAGIQTIIVLNQESIFLCPADGKVTKEFLDAYVGMIKEVVPLFAEHHPAFEIWNEPDGKSESSIYLEPKSFGILLGAAYNAVKEISPSSPVISGGASSGDPNYFNEITAMYGGNIPADGIGVHPYPVGSNPVQHTLNVIRSYQRFNKPLWITEVGAQGDSPEIAAYLKGVLDGNPQVRVFVWYMWSDAMHPGWGLVRGTDSSTKKLVYDVMASATKTSAGFSTERGGHVDVPEAESGPAGGECGGIPDEPAPIPMCPENGINQVVDLTFAASWKELAANTLFNKSLYKIKGVGAQNIALPQNVEWLSDVTRHMLPHYFTHIKSEDPLNVPPGATAIIENRDEIPITMRGMVSADLDVVAKDNTPTTELSQNKTTIHNLYKDTHSKESQKIDDNQRILSCLTSKESCTKNTENAINLTKPSNVLAEKIEVPCNPSETGMIEGLTSAPDGDNAFEEDEETDNGLIFNVTTSFIAFIGDLADKALTDEQKEQFEDTLEKNGVPLKTKLCTCTMLSNETDLRDNTKNGTTGLLPKEIGDKFVDEQHQAKFENGNYGANKISDPFDEKATKELTPSFSFTKGVTDIFHFEVCKALDFTSPMYEQNCSRGKVSTNSLNNLPLDKEDPPGAVPGDIATLLAGIPENFISMELTPEQYAYLMSQIQVLIDTYVKTGRWRGSQLANKDYQRQIHEYADANNINEAFLYALWIEETHASSAGTFPFGCGRYTEFSDSLNCVALNSVTSTYIRKPLPEALCRYADGHYPCDFTAHPNFIPNLTAYIRMLYQL